LDKFRACFDENFWANIAPIAGAVQACQLLANAGFELVCVTALESKFAKARLLNLEASGFPIKKVITTSHEVRQTSPKADVVNQLKPCAFVDDFLPYMRGINRGIHKALILRDPNGSPNTGPELDLLNSTHRNLAEFADAYMGMVRVGQPRRTGS